MIRRRRPGGRRAQSDGLGLPISSTGSIDKTASAVFGQRKSCPSATRYRSPDTWILRPRSTGTSRRGERRSQLVHGRATLLAEQLTQDVEAQFLLRAEPQRMLGMVAVPVVGVGVDENRKPAVVEHQPRHHARELA